MFGHCGRQVSLRNLLSQRVIKCRRDNAEMRHLTGLEVRHKSCSSQEVRPSDPDVTVLQEREPGRSRVRVTLANNPAVIVCHHPPNKVRDSLFGEKFRLFI